MKKKIIFNYPNLILAAISIISLWLIIFLYKRSGFSDDVLTVGSFVGAAWLLVLIDKIFRIKFPSFVFITYYAFLVLSLLFGSLLNFYDIFWWYNRIIHVIGGILFAFLGIFIIVRIDNIGYLKFSVLLTYTIFFAGFCTSVWEVFEFSIDNIFNMNIQRVDTGVHDTMLDIIMGLLGAGIVSGLLIIDNYVYKNKYLEKLINRI